MAAISDERLQMMSKKRDMIYFLVALRMYEVMMLMKNIVDDEHIVMQIEVIIHEDLKMENLKEKVHKRIQIRHILNEHE